MLCALRPDSKRRSTAVGRDEKATCWASCMSGAPGDELRQMANRPFDSASTGSFSTRDQLASADGADARAEVDGSDAAARCGTLPLI